MKIPLLDLQKQYLSIKDEIERAVNNVLNNCDFIMGEEVKKFEFNFKEKMGSKFSISCASGSDALLLCLMAMDIKPGDEVITSDYTFFATAGAITRLGAIPVFIDINEEDCNINPELIEEKINSKTKAIIPVHMYGKCSDMEKILSIADKYSIPVIEDACQGIYANYRFKNGNIKKSGTMGLAGCYSFFPSKNLGGAGDGGMIVTDNKEFAEKLKILRLHGAEPKYYHKFIGINSRLDTIQAAILNVKLQYLEEWSLKRIEKAKIYEKLLNENGLKNYFNSVKFYNNYDFEHTYHLYPIWVENREQLRGFLNDNGISTGVNFPKTMHEQACFKYLCYDNSGFNISLEKAKNVVVLPIFPELSELEQKYIVKNLKLYFII
jgi:dTDP-4-amino-4,6-dideoxygalactose transaminase